MSKVKGDLNDSSSQTAHTKKHSYAIIRLSNFCSP